MTHLRSFWSYRIENGKELMLEPPYGSRLVLTQVAIADASDLTSRATLRASVESVLTDEPQVNGEFPVKEYDVLLTSFLPNDAAPKAISLGFSKNDICFLKASGATLLVNGYMFKPLSQTDDLPNE
jgi:hypothetical protein